MSTPPRVQFLLTGFIQDKDDRVFSFDGVNVDRTKTPVQVRIDTRLARRYGIRTQELPLLCRCLLDRRAEGEHHAVIVFGEEEMSRYRAEIALRTAEAKIRRPPRKPSPTAARSPWHAPRIGPS